MNENENDLRDFQKFLSRSNAEPTGQAVVPATVSNDAPDGVDDFKSFLGNKPSEPAKVTQAETEVDHETNILSKEDRAIMMGINPIGQPKKRSFLSRFGSSLVGAPLEIGKGVGQTIEAIKDAPSDIVEGVVDIKDDIVKRSKRFIEETKSLSDVENGITGEAFGAPLEAGLGIISDTIGNIVITAGKIVSPPDVEEAAAELVKSGATSLSETEVAEAMAGAWNELPEGAQENLKDLGMVGGFLLDVVGVGAAKQVAGAGGRTTKRALEPQLDKAGENLAESARESFKKQAGEIVTERLEDIGVKGRKKKIQQGRVEDAGVTRKVSPDDDLALEIATDLVESGKLSPSQSTIRQSNVMRNEIGIEADKLRETLLKEGRKYEKSELEDFMSKARNELLDSPTLVGDAEKSAAKIMKGLDNILKETGDGVADLLEARKSFDKWLLDNGVNLDKLSDTGKANNLAVKNIRNSLNDFVASKTDSIDVKDSLKRQTAMYRATDVIEDKFAREATGLLGRGLQNLQNIAGIPRTEIIETLGFIGLGVAGAGVGGAPLALGAGGALVARKISKGIPRLKQRLSKSLKTDPEAAKLNSALDDMKEIISPKGLILPAAQVPKEINTEDR